VIKIGGRGRQSLTKARLHLTSGHPGRRLRHTLSLAFGGVMNIRARA